MKKILAALLMFVAIEASAALPIVGTPPGQRYMISGSSVSASSLTVSGYNATVQIQGTANPTLVLRSNLGASNGGSVAFQGTGGTDIGVVAYGQSVGTGLELAGSIGRTHLFLDLNGVSINGGVSNVAPPASSVALDVQGATQFGSGATKSTFTATGDLNVGGIFGQNIGNFTSAVDSSAIFVSSTGSGSWYFVGSPSQASLNVQANKNATASVTSVVPPLLNLVGRRWNGSASAGVSGSFNLTPNATAADSVLGIGFNDVNGQQIGVFHDSRVSISTLTATYGGGSAYVCVTNAGFIFASEAACP